MLKFAGTLYFACVLSVAVAPALAQQSSDINQTIDTVLGDHTKYQAAVAALQTGVANHDAVAVSALVSYPIKVRLRGKASLIKSPADFVKNYNAIITPPIAKVIANQKYDDLMVNSQGIMFGKGEVWINGICKDSACSKFDVKVITIQDAPI